MLAMASLKAVLQGNSFLGRPAVLPCCRAYAFMVVNLDNDGLSCIDDLHWEASLDMCCMCTLQVSQYTVIMTIYSIAVYVRSISRWLLPKAFVWCRFTCDPYKP